MKTKRQFFFLHTLAIALLLVLPLSAQTVYRVSDKARWTGNALSQYVGQTIRLADDWYVCSNYNGYRISPRRIFSPTNQALPQSAAYETLLTLNNNGTVSLSGVEGYHRTGERLHNAVVRVTSTGSLTLQSGQWTGNTRADIQAGYDRRLIDLNGKHTLLVCAANLRYYLVENMGTGMGADDYAEHQIQRRKVSEALALINADIYALVEVEQGQSALAEIAVDLTKKTGRNFTYINDGTVSSGSYTKSGYVYCTATVRPHSLLRGNNTGVRNRKYFQCFEERATGERFLLSINHFKAKSGNGSGDNADHGDGQGSFNGDRVREAQSVLTEYANYKTFVQDEDLLVMGDLNAYAMEDPIRLMTDNGLTDLHRYFHRDSSYSYVYSSQAGYLDHALCNSTMLPQVTGMLGFHINSDERDTYSYNRSDDGTMFRYSDHDPILVGLRLRPLTQTLTEIVSDADMLFGEGYLSVNNAQGGILRVYDMQGRLQEQMNITSETYTLNTSSWRQGTYIAHLYYKGEVLHRKLLIP